jgi:hypothetical protein
MEVETGKGVIYTPDPSDTYTNFSIEARDLGTTTEAGDLGALRTGFLRGLRSFRRSRIESEEAEAIGRLTTMEARHTYLDGGGRRGVRRKRWVRLLYQGSTQVRLVAQGATVERFDYWLPMFFESMRTFRFGDWAVDAGLPGWATEGLSDGETEK